VYAPAQIVVRVSNTSKKARGEKAAPALFSARAMRKGTALTLALDVAPYALVALVVFTAALGSPVLAQLCAVVIVVYVGNAAFGECDLASAALGDAPRSAYDGKVVWITGASQGLGETLAVHLGSMGAKLILSSRREETLRRVCDAARAAGARDARALTLDARAGSAAMREKGAAALALAKEMASGASEDETDAMMNTDDAGVDYIFHVAGGSQHAAAEDTADEVDRDMFELNTMSAIALTKALLPSMLQRRSGTIVAVGSMAVKCPAPGQGHVRGDQSGALSVLPFAPRRSRRSRSQRHGGAPGANRHGPGRTDTRHLRRDARQVHVRHQAIAPAIARKVPHAAPRLARRRGG
jgi:dehydrogenase/reductase SDR family protein 7